MLIVVAQRLAFLFRRPLVFVLAVTLTVVPALAQTADTFKLTGGITHSDRLDPMPEEERIGASAAPGHGDARGTQQRATTNYPESAALSRTPLNAAATAVAPTTSGATSSTTSATIPQLNPIYAKPHIDAWQGQYKNRLRQLAQQNAQASVNQGRRTQKVQIKVPLWLAGQWQRTESTETSRKELPSGKALKAVGKQTAIVTDNFGLFKDRRGNVFMIIPLGNVGAIDRGFAVDYHQVKKYDLVMLGKNSALVKVQATHRVVDKKGQKVIAAYQDEELTKYTLVSDGLVKNDSSVKVFDQMGQPKLLTRAVSVERRVKKI